jgi:hypothetical protein
MTAGAAASPFRFGKAPTAAATRSSAVQDVDAARSAPTQRRGRTGLVSHAVSVNTLLANLVTEGWQITADQLGQIAPYLRAHISRFGAYATDDLRRQPDPFDPLLKEVDFTEVDLAA